jgi:hypothetical protein
MDSLYLSSSGLPGDPVFADHRLAIERLTTVGGYWMPRLRGA